MNRDCILEDLEVALGALREELHIYAKNRGTMVGNITIVDNGDEIDCRRMGSGGYAVPIDHRAGRDPVQEVRSEVRPARRKGHGLGPVQRRPLLGKAQLHPDRTAAASRRAACADCCSRLNEELKLPIYLPARLRPVGALHLQRHQAGLDQPRVRIRAARHPRRQVPRHPRQGLRASAS